MSVPEALLRDGAAPIVIGHRGSSATHPENTMPAFRAAFADGAKWIETDVQPTRDNQLVLIHDGTVDRTTNGHGRVRELTGEAVLALDAGSSFGPEFAGVPVPTFDQLLAELAADTRLLLEIKGNHTTEQLGMIIEHIEAAGAMHRVVLQSFTVPVLERLRALLPDEPIGLLVEGIGADPVGDCRRLGAVTYNPDFHAILEHPEIVGILHQAGIATIPWFVNDPADWATLTELGVDGIFTDRPGDLLAWQAERAA